MPCCDLISWIASTPSGVELPETRSRGNNFLSLRIAVAFNPLDKAILEYFMEFWGQREIINGGIFDKLDTLWFA